MNGVKDAANAGYALLKAGGSAIDAVEAALRSMEDDEYLNAGKTSAHHNFSSKQNKLNQASPRNDHAAAVR